MEFSCEQNFLINTALANVAIGYATGVLTCLIFSMYTFAVFCWLSDREARIYFTSEKNIYRRKEIQSSKKQSAENSSISENSESLDEGTTSSESSDNTVQTPIILRQGIQNFPTEEGGDSSKPSEVSNVIQTPLSYSEFIKLSKEAHNKCNDKRLETCRVVDATTPKNDIEPEPPKTGAEQPRLIARSTSKYILMDDINNCQIYPLDAKCNGGHSPYDNKSGAYTYQLCTNLT